VNLYGVRTLADEFYLFYAVDPSPTAVAMVLVLPGATFLAGLTGWAVTRRRRIETSLYESSASASLPDGSERNAVTESLAMLGAVVLSTLLFAFPAVGLVLKAGQQITVSDDAGGRAVASWSLRHCVQLLAAAPGEFTAEYAWTAVLAAGTVCCCVPVAWILAAIGRTRSRLRMCVDLVSLVMVLIPGPLVGLAVIGVFQWPFPGFHVLYHETVVPTLAALSVRALPISYWVMRTGYAGVDRSVLDVARIDLSWCDRMMRVDRVLVVRPLLVAAFAAALSAGGDVPAILPVIPPEVVTVGTRLFALLHSGARNQEAALAFWYVAAMILVALALAVCWKPRRR